MLKINLKPYKQLLAWTLYRYDSLSTQLYSFILCIKLKLYTVYWFFKEKWLPAQIFVGI